MRRWLNTMEGGGEGGGMHVCAIVRSRAKEYDKRMPITTIPMYDNDVCVHNVMMPMFR